MEKSEVYKELEKMLGREPDCSRLPDGRFMANYFKYGALPKDFTGVTAEEAYGKLLSYLKAAQQKQDV